MIPGTTPTEPGLRGERLARQTPARGYCSGRRAPRRFRRVLAAVALLFALAAGATLAAPQPAEAQCAMCRSAFDSPEGRRMIRKYQIGIAFLLTVPFAAFGTVAYLAVKGKKKLEGESEDA